jgi:hypothetical protein
MKEEGLYVHNMHNIVKKHFTSIAPVQTWSKNDTSNKKLWKSVNAARYAFFLIMHITQYSLEKQRCALSAYGGSLAFDSFSSSSSAN